MKELFAKRIPLAWFLLACIAVAGVGVLWLALARNAAPANAVLIEDASTRTPGTSTPEAGATSLVVYVSGAVQKPGVYTLPLGSRIGDAVGAASGLAPDANPEAVNLAERLTDGEHVSVPRMGEAQAPTSPAAVSQSANAPAPTSTKSAKSASKTPTATGQKVNINTASESELEALPGIGSVLAKRIVDERQAHGPFASVDDLKRVQGIKASVIDKLRDLVTTRP